jgi:hypothetical protein
MEEKSVPEMKFPHLESSSLASRKKFHMLECGGYIKKVSFYVFTPTNKSDFAFLMFGFSSLSLPSLPPYYIFGAEIRY